MAVNHLTAYPYGLEFLCNYGSDKQALHKNLIAPLCWFGFGSTKELLDMPLSLLNRYSRMMEEEGMVDKFRQYQDPYFKSRGRRVR